MDMPFNAIEKTFFKNNSEGRRLKGISEKTSTAEKGPDYVTIDITNRCNLNCAVCWTYSPFLEKGKPEE